MIAPLRTPDDNTSTALREARRVVALLLPARQEEGSAAPAVAPWQAWLLVAWMGVTTCVYLWSMWRGMRGG
jgi:hypothetical protein